MYAYREKNRLLAGFVPATSFAAGSSELSVLAKDGVNNNINMNDDCRVENNGGSIFWPQERLNDDDFSDRWTHSDLKNVAYPYIYPFYENILSK